MLVALVAFLAAAGHGGYLALMTSTAKKRPGGDAVVEFAKKRAPVAGGTLAVTLLALLLAGGGNTAGIFAILLGGGAGVVSVKALQSSQSRLRSGDL